MNRPAIRLPMWETGKARSYEATEADRDEETGEPLMSRVAGREGGEGGGEAGDGAAGVGDYHVVGAVVGGGDVNDSQMGRVRAGNAATVGMGIVG